MASDFIGKDVRGKAVFVYSFPSPSSLIQSASWMGSLTRAQEKGAAALFIVLAIPGNVPAEGLRTATQAFAKIFDDIDRLELKDLRPQ